MSSRSISFRICAVASASTPGSPAIIAGIGADGLPTRFKWMRGRRVYDRDVPLVGKTTPELVSKGRPGRACTQN
jgi:hypothetical protein